MKIKTIKTLLGIALLLSAALLVGLAYLVGGFLAIPLLVAAADLVATVFWKPLIGPGPLAKSMYPGLED